LELKILEERPNPLLQRVEYRFEVSHAEAATPTIDAVRTALAQQLKMPKDRLVIEGMHARFGAAQTRGAALAYKTSEAVMAVSREHILIRNGLKEKAVPAPPGAAPAEAPSAPEKPTAEKAEKAEKVEKPTTASKAESPDKPEKPAKAEKAEKAPKPEKHEAAPKAEKGEKTEKPPKAEKSADKKAA
jgi:ribosomal protein S24E